MKGRISKFGMRFVPLEYEMIALHQDNGLGWEELSELDKFHCFGSYFSSGCYISDLMSLRTQ